MTGQDNEPDFAAWARTWQDDAQQAASAEHIRAYVTKRSRTVRMFMVVDFIIAAVALPVVGYLWWIADNAVERLSMLGLAAITIAAVAFGFWNWSAVVRTAASTTADYVALSSERLRRMRIMHRAGWAVLAAQLAVFTVWTRNRLYGPGIELDAAAERFAWLWLAGFVIVAALSLAWFGRWLARDSARFERLRLELESEAIDQLSAASTSVGDNTRITSAGARATRKPRRPPLR
jgi:hypothetical protein